MDFLITISACCHAAQTISSTKKLLDARGSIIVGTQDLVVAPSAKLKPFAAWLNVVSKRVSLNSSSMGINVKEHKLLHFFNQVWPYKD